MSVLDTIQPLTRLPISGETERGQELITIAKSIVERFNNRELSNISITNKAELPTSSGVYMAITSDRQILYIGMAKNLLDRCDLDTHHKLPLAMEKGATRLLVAHVNDSEKYYVEQWLINHFKPLLNTAEIDLWWTKSCELPERKEIYSKGIKYALKKPLKAHITPDKDEKKSLILYCTEDQKERIRHFQKRMAFISSANVKFLTLYTEYVTQFGCVPEEGYQLNNEHKMINAKIPFTVFEKFNERFETKTGREASKVLSCNIERWLDIVQPRQLNAFVASLSEAEMKYRDEFLQIFLDKEEEKRVARIQHSEWQAEFDKKVRDSTLSYIISKKIELPEKTWELLKSRFHFYYGNAPEDEIVDYLVRHGENRENVQSSLMYIRVKLAMS